MASRAALLICVLVSAMPRQSSAQARPVVPIEARVYGDIERLGALGLIDTLLLGVQPVTESEIVRRLREARANIDRNPSAREWARSVIAEGLARYDRAGTRLFDEAGASVIILSSPPRAAPSDESGTIDAVINPLVAYSGGRTIVDGITAALETRHTALLGRFLAAAFTPRLSVVSPRGGDVSSGVDVMGASVDAVFGDFAIEIGRGYASFGQARTGGTVLSHNAPPLDMIRIWNDRPWRVPLWSRVFRDLRGTLIVADLGRTRQIYPHTKLIAYHVAMLPHPRLELGFQVADAMGGNGGQPASFGDRVLDVIPVIDAFRTTSDFQFSNKLAGINLRVRVPELYGFELYAEGTADDFDGRDFARGFLEDAGYVAGVSLSCFAMCGRLAVRAEYHQTGIRYYTHTNYPMSSRGFVLGDPLGPRGVGGRMIADADLGALGRFDVEGAFEVRSGNTYRAATTGPNDVGFHFVQVLHRPGEKRARVFARWASDDRRMLSLRLTAGAERVANFGFVGGDDRTNGLFSVGLVARP